MAGEKDFREKLGTKQMSIDEAVALTIDYMKAQKGLNNPRAEACLQEELKEIFDAVVSHYGGLIPPNIGDTEALYDLFYQEVGENTVREPRLTTFDEPGAPIVNDGTDLEEPRIPALEKKLKVLGIKTKGLAGLAYAIGFTAIKSGQKPRNYAPTQLYYGNSNNHATTATAGGTLLPSTGRHSHGSGRIRGN